MRISQVNIWKHKDGVIVPALSVTGVDFHVIPTENCFGNVSIKRQKVADCPIVDLVAGVITSAVLPSIISVPSNGKTSEGHGEDSNVVGNVWSIKDSMKRTYSLKGHFVSNDSGIKPILRKPCPDVKDTFIPDLNVRFSAVSQTDTI